jgi:hypothetical protein
LLDVTAERRRAAGRDRADDASLDPSKMSGVGSAVGFAVATKHLGQFERRPRRHRPFRHLQRQPIQRARGLGDDLRRDARVAGRRRQILVSEQHLDDANVDTALQQMGGEAVA